MLREIRYTRSHMEQIITAEERKVQGTDACRKIREQGKMPAIVYGAGQDALMITLNTKEFERVWSQAGESTIITIKGIGEDKQALIKDVSLDPHYDTPSHADLYLVKKDVVVSVDVPLVFVGVAAAEKSLGGTLIKVMHNLAVEALPKDLPAEVEVDISKLETFEDKIHVRDIVLPTGVSVDDADKDEVVALVQEQRAEDESKTEIDLSSVEVVKKGKEVTPPEE